jgi:tetratricopeptide (TPR) repeat protein
MCPSPVHENKDKAEVTSQSHVWPPRILAACSLLAIFTTYLNHFQNSFHFDDFNTITQNPAIRSLAHVPHFFRDASTYSIFPTHYSYRPLVSASAAVDYWLGGGLNPLWFHISTFVWYLAQLALMYLLFIRVMNFSRHSPNNRYVALFATVWYGLHPAIAETINYVNQRADVYVALGITGGLVIFSQWPASRKRGLYLLPPLVGALAKPVALVFPATLFVYVLLFGDTDRQNEATPFDWVRVRRAAFACLPAAAACAVLCVFELTMTPKVSFADIPPSRTGYWLTQPIVALHYFKTFFLPTELSADTDRQFVSNILSETSVIGLAFLGALILGIGNCLRSRERRPIAYGLSWFLITMLPTSVIPLAEAENDHRMFLPFIGLVLAVSWAGALFLERRKERWLTTSRRRAALADGLLSLLAVYAYGTHTRNGVWHTEESLWQDVVQKSPRNGRGWMNYGLSQLSKGDIPAAYEYFRRASLLTANYPVLEINLGIASGALHRDSEAEEHFRRAILLAPQDSQPYFYYGRWLQERSRIGEAILNLSKSAALNTADLDSRYLLMLVHSQQFKWSEVARVAGEILRMVPADPQALRYSALARDVPVRVTAAERQAGLQPTPENYLTLSLQYYQAGRYDDCVRAATEALRLRPDYAEAYNNIAAGRQAMHQWDESIAAAQEAIRLKPDFSLARNNLAYAMSQKALPSAKP